MDPEPTTQIPGVQSPAPISAGTQAPKKWPLILVSLVVLVLIGSFGIILGKQMTTPTSIVPTSIPVAIIPSPTPDPTSNWKTYSTQGGEYSFKYPTDWTYQALSEGCGPSWFAPNTTKVWLTVCGININGTPQLVANDIIQPPDAKLISSKQITINGHDGIYQIHQLGIQKSIDVFIGNVPVQVIHPGQNGGQGYTEQATGTLPIIFYVQDLTQWDKTSETFDQILSTFKFTN